MGEQARLRERAARFFERAETELRQLFRDAALQPERATTVPASVAAGLVLAFVEARMSRFSRSELSPFSPRGVGGAVGGAGGGALFKA